MKKWTLVWLISIGILIGKNAPKGNNKIKPDDHPLPLAGCSEPSAMDELNLNNVKASIYAAGDMWWDLQNNAKYEIPKGSGTHAMFVSTLWLAGLDVSNQLKGAAFRYRTNEGPEYYTGPLNTKTADIEPTTCAQWNKIFRITKEEVQQFIAWYEAGLYDAQNGTNTQAELFPNYQIPQIILEWPAHGRNYPPYYEDFYLAPFKDRNNDGVYNPYDGDYPFYDFKGEVDCRARMATLYGDLTLWWIFNDKGNVHQASKCTPLGFEIRAQAFAFATNDEVNDMTFYNYVIVNRSSFTLAQTYFGVNCDPDLGCYIDDYVGCDVLRGLGYVYNGDEVDDVNCQGGTKGYGSNPPAAGVDYFQGPFQDNDGIDNAVGCGPNEALNGVGYGDGIVDNERFGMRRFIYYTNPLPCNSCPSCSDPESCIEYYNFLRGIWKDGSVMVYGGNGYPGTQGSTNIPAAFMFPGASDTVCWWGTGGIDPGFYWTETNLGPGGGSNQPCDRRFVFSAGPFTLLPGQTNFITFGVAWARATTGGALASLQKLLIADQKTQAMFDNCFRIIEGPHAPDLTIRELDRTLIFYITNPANSNNYLEKYAERDPFISLPDTLNGIPLTPAMKDSLATYRFEGYMVFQLKDHTVGPSDLWNYDKARLVFQCDIKNGVTRLINFEWNEQLGADVPKLYVDGNDQGILHSFVITEDKFATGTDKRLINYKTYYYMAIAYAYNEYKPYKPNDVNYLDGQKRPFLPSRKAPIGAIKVFSGVPHKVDPHYGGTVLNAQYGDMPEITRYEGEGSGNSFIKIKKEYEQNLFSPPYKIDVATYEKGYSPVIVKVVDPLAVPPDSFVIQFLDSATWKNTDDAYWVMYPVSNPNDKVYSDKTINLGDEKLILKWGLSVFIQQPFLPGNKKDELNGFLGSSIEFLDPNKEWLEWFEDKDGDSLLDWIRSGASPTDIKVGGSYIDSLQVYERVLNGGWAPFNLTSADPPGPNPHSIYLTNVNLSNIAWTPPVDIIITPDKSKWSRVPVIEMQDNQVRAVRGAKRGTLRRSPSVNKDGKPYSPLPPPDTLKYTIADTIFASNNPNDPNFIFPWGMGWFPGYAYDVSSGERLNMAFGEDSWLKAENGADMIWNPTSRLYEGINLPVNARLGGKHYIYVFRSGLFLEENDPFPTSPANDPNKRMTPYDHGKFAVKMLATDLNSPNGIYARNVWRNCIWVGFPKLKEGKKLLDTEVRISLRTGKKFAQYPSNQDIISSPSQKLVDGATYLVNCGPIVYNGKTYKRGDTLYVIPGINTFTATTNDSINCLSRVINGGYPLYGFSTRGLAPVKDSLEKLREALKLINIVPNPYYGASDYEKNRLDTRVKITNVPRNAIIKIYTLDGNLVRTLQKGESDECCVEWDLKNEAKVPISGGIYIIHVSVPNVGERTLKWFGIMRPTEILSF